jgi:predicted transcriptional regulator
MRVVCSESDNVELGADVVASIRKNFAYNLRRLIEDSGLRDKQVADQLGISASRLSKWLSQSAFSEEAFDLLREKMGWTYEQLVRDPATVSLNDLFDAVKRLASDAGYDLVKRD